MACVACFKNAMATYFCSICLYVVHSICGASEDIAGYGKPVKCLIAGQIWHKISCLTFFRISERVGYPTFFETEGVFQSGKGVHFLVIFNLLSKLKQSQSAQNSVLQTKYHCKYRYESIFMCSLCRPCFLHKHHFYG